MAVHFGISLVRRLRHGLFFVVGICLEKHVCKIREGPCTRFQALFASARVPDVRRHAFRTSVPKVRVESEEKSAVNLNIVVATWTQCSLVSHAHALNHDGTTFAEQRRTLEEVMYRKNAATNYQAERRCTLVVNKPQITDSLEVFLSSTVCSCVRNLGGFRQQALGRLHCETDHGCSVEACSGAHVKDTHTSFGHESECRRAEVRG